jgi:hypothetical protein
LKGAGGKKYAGFPRPGGDFVAPGNKAGKMIEIRKGKLKKQRKKKNRKVKEERRKKKTRASLDQVATKKLQKFEVRNLILQTFFTFF